MKKLIYDVEKLDHFGRGIAKDNGMPIFIDNSLPGEKVEVLIDKKKKNYIEAQSINIISQSLDRVNPLCPYYNNCGGCNIMHMNYAKQLKFKENKVKEVLKKFCNFEKVSTIIGTNEFYYRNKITLQVKEKIGYYKKKSYEIVQIDNCLIVDKKINAIIQKIHNINLYGIKQIVIRSTSNQIMLVFYADTFINIDIKNFEDVNTIVVISDEKVVIKGKGYIEEELNGIKYIISPTSFFQVNLNGMINLYNKVLDYAKLTGKENLLDLYCGTGTIGIYLSEHCKKVVGIELNKEAICDALLNKEINKINNIDFEVGDVKEVLKKNKFIPDIIIVDPPRAGLDRKVIDEINTLKPKKLIYVSCDVVTLARDLNLLSNDFELIECTPVDMFPNTYHVECVSLLHLKHLEK